MNYICAIENNEQIIVKNIPVILLNEQ